jgi:hypothetical protein
MYIIFQIDGGMGKSVAATAVCKAIKTKYPQAKLIVVTGYPDVFACNPYVYKALNTSNLQYFYQDYIKDQKDVLIFAHNPYVSTPFIREEGHLIKVWCELFDIPYNGELPEIFMSNVELNRHALTMQTPKPMMVIQTNGGSVEHGLYSWVRDVPQSIAQEVVNAFCNDYTIVHLRLKEQLALQNTHPVQASNFRMLVALIALSSKRLFIDSFAQHTAAAIGRPSVVCWIGNKPTQFGYEMHANIVAGPPTRQPDLKYAIYSPYGIAGQNPMESCYNFDRDIFNPEVIIDVLRKYPEAMIQQPQQAPAIANNESTNNLEVLMEDQTASNNEKNDDQQTTKKTASRKN